MNGPCSSISRMTSVKFKKPVSRAQIKFFRAPNFNHDWCKFLISPPVNRNHYWDSKNTTANLNSPQTYPKQRINITANLAHHSLIFNIIHDYKQRQIKEQNRKSGKFLTRYMNYSLILPEYNLKILA
jgi:hypothetical protein